MKINKDKIAGILSKEYSFYDQSGRSFMFDARMTVNVSYFIKNSIKSHFRVLDVGCGDGHSLLRFAASFHEGIGIDNNKEHIKLANENLKKNKVKNVKFILGDLDNLPFQEKEFDFVYSERGPLSVNNRYLQNAVRVVKNQGIIFSENIGELDSQEAKVFFNKKGIIDKNQFTTVEDQVKVLFERNGIDIRIINNQISKMVFQDIYEWLGFQCCIRKIYDIKLPTIDDIDLIQRFYDMFKTKREEIVVTKHRIWIGGIKTNK